MILSRGRLEVTRQLVLDSRAAGEWCRLPYPGHKHGCPNYGKRPTCPPAAPSVADFIDLLAPHWLVYVDFDLAGHIDKMRDKHPAWSERQLRCCLYWQNSARAALVKEVDYHFRGHAFIVHTMIPEAMGVNVLETAWKVGIPVVDRPIHSVYKIALVGHEHRRT